MLHLRPLRASAGRCDTGHPAHNGRQKIGKRIDNGLHVATGLGQGLRRLQLRRSSLPLGDVVGRKNDLIEVNPRPDPSKSRTAGVGRTRDEFALSS
jgi:hypothetical protein